MLVRYMIGEVKFGAELTDENDIRLIRTLCEMWFSDDLFSASFTFTPSVPSPRLSSLQEYLDYFNSLPDYDSPEEFGLTPTADITLVNTTISFTIVYSPFILISELKITDIIQHIYDKLIEQISREVITIDADRPHRDAIVATTQCPNHFVPMI